MKERFRTKVYEHVRGAFVEYRLYKWQNRNGQKVKYRHSNPKFMLTMFSKATDLMIRTHLGLTKDRIEIIRDKKEPLARPNSSAIQREK